MVTRWESQQSWAPTPFSLSVSLSNMYLFGCTAPQLRLMRSSVFIVCEIFSCSVWTLSCGMWDLVPQPGIKPRPPALGAWTLVHWTTGEVLKILHVTNKREHTLPSVLSNCILLVKLHMARLPSPKSENRCQLSISYWTSILIEGIALSNLTCMLPAVRTEAGRPGWAHTCVV